MNTTPDFLTNTAEVYAERVRSVMAQKPPTTYALDFVEELCSDQGHTTGDGITVWLDMARGAVVAWGGLHSDPDKIRLATCPL
jgi:hypothetical protein